MSGRAPGLRLEGPPHAQGAGDENVKAELPRVTSAPEDCQKPSVMQQSLLGWLLDQNTQALTGILRSSRHWSGGQAGPFGWECQGPRHSSPFPERRWASSLTHAPSALFVSLSDLQRPPFSLPRTVAPLQGPPFPQPRGLRPLRFCTTAQLPRIRLSLQGPPVPSGTLAACSLLSQVAFIGLSLGVVVLSYFHGNCCGPRKPEQLLVARAGACLAISATQLRD